MEKSTLNNRQALPHHAWSKVRPALIAGGTIVVLVAMAYWGGAAKPGPLFFLGIAVLTGMILLFGLLTWWLYLSPMPADTPRAIARSTETRQLVVLLIVAAGLLFVIGAFWDETWHRTYGIGGPINDFFWRPHLMIYGSMALLNLIAVGGLALTLRAGSDLRQRFRAEPLLGLLGLVAGYLALSAPSDLLWHRIYGLDITAWSLPHLILAGGFAMVMLVAVAVQLSMVPRRAWDGLRGLQGQEGLALLLIALAATIMLQSTVPEWEGLKVIGGAGASGSRLAAFWRRPEWLYPVVVIMVSFFISSFALHALRRAGAASCVAWIVLGLRLVLFTIFGTWSSGVGMSLIAQLLLLPPALALDVWYWARLAHAETDQTLVGGNLLALVVFLAGGLPLLPFFLIYPRLTAATLPGMIGFGSVMALWSGWVGARFGAWLGALDRRVEAEAPMSARVVWTGLGALTAFVTFAAFFILTARPPAT